MPQVDQVRKRSPKPAILAAVVLSVVVLVGIGAVVWYMAQPKPLTVKEALLKADDLNNHAKFAEAKTVLLDAQTRAKTTADKASIISRLAQVESNTNELAAALKDYQEYEKLVPNEYANTANIAELAERMNNTKLAIEEYNKAITLLEAEPTNGDDTLKQRHDLEAGSLREHVKELSSP